MNVKVIKLIMDRRLVLIFTYYSVIKARKIIRGNVRRVWGNIEFHTGFLRVNQNKIDHLQNLGVNG
jgi:hypothetical protein